MGKKVENIKEYLVTRTHLRLPKVYSVEVIPRDLSTYGLQASCSCSSLSQV